MQDFEKSYDSLAKSAKEIFDRNARKMRGKIEEEEHQTFSVVAPNSQAYEVDGEANPDLNLVRGEKYVFEVNATGHPFYIKTDKTGGEGDQYTDGVTNNGLEKGTLEFEVPADAPDILYYVCAYHPVMVGTLNIVDPAKLEEGTGKYKGETWEQGFERRVVKTTKPEHLEKGFKWRIKGKERDEISIKLYKNKPDFKEFTKQMKRVAGHEFGG